MYVSNNLYIMVAILWLMFGHSRHNIFLCFVIFEGVQYI